MLAVKQLSTSVDFENYILRFVVAACVTKRQKRAYTYITKGTHQKVDSSLGTG